MNFIAAGLLYLGKKIGFWFLGETAKAAVSLTSAVVDEVERMDWSELFGTDKSEAKRAEAFNRIRERLTAEGIAIVSNVTDNAKQVSINQINAWIESMALKHP